MRRLPGLLCLLILAVLPSGFARSEEKTVADFEPDPRSVQRDGPAYRYPQAGWIVLHIEGKPYERGCQHGRLLAPEIAAHVRCFAAVRSPKAPADGWRATRTIVNSLFLRRYDREFLEEMKGIADGASAAGARFDNRPIDLLDIVALNSWPELETLNSALEATPTGLEGIRFSQEGPKAMPPAKPMHCSAFAATGPATRDGKIVFGHITMFSLYPSSFYNVWLDVKPANGHRVLMQTYPGGIQSGLDYYINDAGILVCETTLAQTHFDIQGQAVASRIRRALQDADRIDQVVAVLEKANNGLYTNEWLLADIKTNEIAMFELGTYKSKLWRSSKDEWYGGTRGFYWGCNNAKDLAVRLETVAAVDGRPSNVIFRPSSRDRTWLRLYDQHRGKMDADFGKLAFTTPPLAAFHSVDAKFTTSDLAHDLKTWALFGPPLGRTWQPTREERERYPEVRPLVSNPWAILHARPPAASKTRDHIVDLPAIGTAPRRPEDAPPPPTVPAWHGTLLPAGDADVWLAAAFADCERIAALENALRKRSHDSKLSAADRDELALALFAYRADYELGARARPETALARIHRDDRDNDWYRVASGKGVLLLHSLRRQMGGKAFEAMMDAFGRDHAGKSVTATQFQAHVEKWVSNRRGDFFEPWLNRTGLPRFQLGKVEASQAARGFEVAVEVRQEAGSPPAVIDVTVETAKGEVTRPVRLEGASARLVIETTERPLRVVVDKYGFTARANGGPFSVLTFGNELEETLIVYGTADEKATNREAAEALQQALRERGPNITVPIKADTEVADRDLQSRHLLLIGRPDSNPLLARFRDALPVTFGSRSFAVRGEVYAHPGSAVLAAAENPLNKRYSLVVVAGLGAASTLRAAPYLGLRVRRAAEVVVVPHDGPARSLVVPARDLVAEVKTIAPAKTAGVK
jgi:hypothetical protein